MANASPLDERVRNVFNASVGVKTDVNLPLFEIAAYVDFLAGDDASRIVFLSFREGQPGQVGDYEMLLITDRFVTVQAFGREKDERAAFYTTGEIFPLSSVGKLAIGPDSGARWSEMGYVEYISPQIDFVAGVQRVSVGGKSGFPIATHSETVPVESIREELLTVLLNAYAPRE